MTDYSPDESNKSKLGTTRRGFLSQLGVAGASLTLAPLLVRAAGDSQKGEDIAAAPAEITSVSLTINGKTQVLNLDSRVTLLDALREKLGLTGTKKGCDHGQCGACTVLADGRRINSCLTLAGMCEGAEIVTIEGLAKGEQLHPMQEAFLKHDGFQCGYCTPGQICSAVGLVKEGHAKTDAEIKELMSGNICRCGAYQNIVAAIKEVQNA
ncbi:(2Fe-2S)-binding protein [Mucilaginibacter agri]|uniref:2Fe-2S iron-sulfur cluster binding domain-containing protein n=1 Tax=Mucilaginibacter agri TaxID=2695265 RepID=A0A966DSG1_9SPHI|nr:2Fe-2S iron-sulfur cluster-binding protein [Mucilaginibacter agri]NCD67764.1 2Fe-2S iron-sulfur cluster binding domain-containing protein [Mucilaginibacter agri]